MLVTQVRQRIVILEVAGFLAVILIMWLDEILDLPHNLFGFQATPVNWVEGLIETFMVLVCAMLVIPFTVHLIKQLRQLRGLLPVCSHCHHVRDENGEWQQIEAYVRDNTGADFSHGICPTCMKKHYPQFCDKTDSRVG